MWRVEVCHQGEQGEACLRACEGCLFVLQKSLSLDTGWQKCAGRELVPRCFRFPRCARAAPRLHYRLLTLCPAAY